MRDIGLVPELYVNDFVKSTAFYIGVLNFKVMYSRPEEKFAYLRKGNAELMIEESTDPVRTWTTGDLVYPFGRGINFQIEVKNVNKLYERVMSSGINPFLELEEHWYRKDELQVGNL